MNIQTLISFSIKCIPQIYLNYPTGKILYLLDKVLYTYRITCPDHILYNVIKFPPWKGYFIKRGMIF